MANPIRSGRSAKLNQSRRRARANGVAPCLAERFRPRLAGCLDPCQGVPGGRTGENLPARRFGPTDTVPAGRTAEISRSRRNARAQAVSGGGPAELHNRAGARCAYAVAACRTESIDEPRCRGRAFSRARGGSEMLRNRGAIGLARTQPIGTSRSGEIELARY